MTRASDFTEMRNALRAIHDEIGSLIEMALVLWSTFLVLAGSIHEHIPLPAQVMMLVIFSPMTAFCVVTLHRRLRDQRTLTVAMILLRSSAKLSMVERKEIVFRKD